MSRLNDAYTPGAICAAFRPECTDRPALFHGKKNIEITYGQLRTRILDAVTLLREHKLTDRNIALLLESGPDFIVSFFATILSGNRAVLASTKLKKEIAPLLETCDAAITDDESAEKIREYAPDAAERILEIGTASLAAAEKGPSKTAPAPIPASRTVCRLFTSGSTGEPKIVDKSVRNLYAEIDVLEKQLACDDTSVFLPLVPSFHIYGLLFGVLLPLKSGGAINMEIPFSPRALIEDGLAGENSYIIGNPTQYKMPLPFIDEYSNKSITTLRCCISSTMPLDPELSRKYHSALGIRILEVYGSTETGGIAFRESATDPAWQPFDGVRCRLTPETDELLVTGPAVSLPAEEAWYATGDIAEMLSENDNRERFRLLGRSNRIMKVGGNRVSAAEIEQFLIEQEDVKEAVVTVSFDNSLRGETLTAYIVLDKNSSGPEALRTIRDNTRKALPHFKVPSKFITAESIPRGANGKILFRKLQQND